MSARGMQRLGEVIVDVVADLERKVFNHTSIGTFNNNSKKDSLAVADHHRVPNDPRLEWMFTCLSRKPKAEQKRLILQARHPSVGFLNDDDVDVLISALGLEGA
jgi:hypothetical protein